MNTPTGQLIIAAAVIDDVIALVLLSELEALEEPSVKNFVVPIVASLGFIGGVGFAAIRLVPGFLAKQVLPRVPKESVEGIMLGSVLATATALLAATHYGKTSYLLGAFLGGTNLALLTSASLQCLHYGKLLTGLGM